MSPHFILSSLAASHHCPLDIPILPSFFPIVLPTELQPFTSFSMPFLTFPITILAEISYISNPQLTSQLEVLALCLMSTKRNSISLLLCSS